MKLSSEIFQKLYFWKIKRILIILFFFSYYIFCNFGFVTVDWIEKAKLFGTCKTKKKNICKNMLDNFIQHKPLIYEEWYFLALPWRRGLQHNFYHQKVWGSKLRLFYYNGSLRYCTLSNLGIVSSHAKVLPKWKIL